jgi:hypothetical protein
MDTKHVRPAEYVTASDTGAKFMNATYNPIEVTDDSDKALSSTPGLFRWEGKPEKSK